jgi:hypothetical protein
MSSDTNTKIGVCTLNTLYFTFLTIHLYCIGSWQVKRTDNWFSISSTLEGTVLEPFFTFLAGSPHQMCLTPSQAAVHTTQHYSFFVTGKQADGEATGPSTCPEIAIAPTTDILVGHEFQKPAWLITNSSMRAGEWVSVNKNRCWFVDG